ncbi:hypothetical protein [Streptomyces sp. TLI_171]|uniref:hypothetical protein n=1 Tax=Streptomyces sp. TLI_171 TaxID=1938859 RepID=UPI000C182B66|nr:hypothetical protein [Streptomyces sp. TLI_171]RKE22345.1 hypothetical protein BX266_5788 [Streptomyces sp. TLI_171]
MDIWRGPARLEWWANDSVCLGDFGVVVEVRVEDGVWSGAASFAPALTAAEQEVAELLFMEPLFHLNLGGGLGAPVEVAGFPGERLVLTEVRR